MNTREGNINKDQRRMDKVESEMMRLKKDNPFVVPDGYFDNLPETIIEYKIKISNKQNINASLIRRLRPVYYLAAAIVILVTTALFLIKSRSESAEASLAELSWEDVVYDNYYVYSDLSVYNIIDRLIAYDMDFDYGSVTKSIELLDAIKYPESDSDNGLEAVINYLVDEDVDIEQFVNM